MSGDSHEVILIVLPATDELIPPTKGAARVLCSDCGRMCWLGTEGRRILRQSNAVHGVPGRAICRDCMRAYPPPRDDSDPILTPEIRASVEEELGHGLTDEEIARVLARARRDLWPEKED